MFAYVCHRKQKQRIMKHRQFKTECFCRVIIREKTFTCSSLREAKEKIYRLGTRGEKYEVDVIDKKTRLINDIYLMLFTKEGPIFQKQAYSRWREEQQKAKVQQITIYPLL